MPDSEPVDDSHPASELHAELELLGNAVGGIRGFVDGSLPTIVFTLVYVFDHKALRPALLAALAVGAVILVVRLATRGRSQQALAGFAGLAVSAYVARQTGHAGNFYLVGLLTNAGYGAVLLISLIVRWPLLGLAAGSLRGDPTGWRADPIRRRAYTLATWSWFSLFAIRLVVEVPLYAAGQVAALGVAKVVLGLPLTMVMIYLTYRIIAPVLRGGR